MAEAKRDKCGVRLDLIPADVLIELSKVLSTGAERYGEYNWQQSRLTGENGPINHALKHLLMYKDGIPDDEDPEGKDLNIHLRHALCNVVFELYYALHPETYGGE